LLRAVLRYSAQTKGVIVLAYVYLQEKLKTARIVSIKKHLNSY